MSPRVWWARLDQLDDDLQATLSVVERERVGSLHREVDRTRSLLGAGLLRRAVAELTGQDPAAVDVRRSCPTCGGPHGRPELPGTGLHASVTHAGDWAGVALAGHPVGLDLEPLAAAYDEATVDAVLAPGEPRPADARAFLARWTAKEAVLKATGDGLACPPEEVVLRATDGGFALVTYRGTPRPAEVRTLAPADDHVGALVTLR